MSKCSICGKPIVLVPSATARAHKLNCAVSEIDACFTTHSACLVAKRNAESTDLMRVIGAEAERMRAVKFLRKISAAEYNEMKGAI